MITPDTIHLLLIEDDELNRDVAKTVLACAAVHCDISEATDVMAAKQLIDKHAEQDDEHPHIIVVDGNLEKGSKNGNDAREILSYADGKLEAFTVGFSSMRLLAVGIEVDVDLTKANVFELDRVIDERFSA